MIKIFTIILQIFILQNCVFVPNDDRKGNSKNNTNELYIMYKIISTLSLENSARIIIKNSSQSKLTLTFQTNEFSVNSSGISDFYRVQLANGKYKIVENDTNVIVDQSDYDFKGIFNDGILIRENATLQNENLGCNIFDRSQGKIIYQNSCYD